MRHLRDKISGKYGSDYSALFLVEESFIIEQTVGQVGFKRARLLKDKTAVKGLILTDAFAKGDPVEVLSGGQVAPTVLLEDHPCTGRNEFGQAMHLDIGKSSKADEYAWLILGEADAAPGDVIGK